MHVYLHAYTYTCRLFVELTQYDLHMNILLLPVQPIWGFILLYLKILLQAV